MAFKDPLSNPLVSTEDGKVILTEEQQSRIIEEWNKRVSNPPSILEICNLIWGEAYDVRSKAGVAIRQFLSERSLLTPKPKPGPSVPIILSEAQKEYIIHNAKLKPLKLAQIIFNDINLTPLHKECKVVMDYYNSLDPKITADLPPSYSYNPPKQHTNAAARINKYVYDGTIKNDQWKTNTQIKSYLDSLIKFCHHPRFILIANSYTEESHRNLFEGAFIGYVWDKVDLTTEELDLYIDICQDIVSEFTMNNEVKIYSQMLDNTAEDAEGKKISLSIGEHIKNLRDEISKNKVRRMKAVETLQGKRSERIENKRKDNDTLIHLVDFIKQKEGRERFAKTVKAKQQGLIDEVARLESVDELIFEIYGIGPEEIVYSKV